MQRTWGLAAGGILTRISVRAEVCAAPGEQPPCLGIQLEDRERVLGTAPGMSCWRLPGGGHWGGRGSESSEAFVAEGFA